MFKHTQSQCADNDQGKKKDEPHEHLGCVQRAITSQTQGVIYDPPGKAHLAWISLIPEEQGQLERVKRKLF